MCPVQALNAGAVDTIRYVVPALVVWSYQVSVTVDDGGDVAELSEDNNGATLSWEVTEVQAPLSLGPSSCPMPSAGLPGQATLPGITS